MANENLVQPPFTPKLLEEEREESGEILTVRLNADDKAMLNAARPILRQPKDSTALKQLAAIGFKCMTSPENMAIINTIHENKRRNKRTGIIEVE